MPLPFFGETAALLAALCWGCALVLFKKSVHQITPLQLNIFKGLVGLTLLLLTVGAQALYLLAAGRPMEKFALTGHELFVLVVSGLCGIALADTLLFVALHLIGVSLMSVVDCIYAPTVILLGWALLGEQITPAHWAGAALIATGVFLSSRHAPPPGRTRGQLVGGMAVGALAIFFIAFGIVYAKPVLPGIPVFWATTVRLVAAMIPLMMLGLLLPRRGELLAMLRPSKVWRTALPGSVLGNYLSLVFWVAGFKYADAAINGILNQTSVIFAIVLATVFLHEPLTRRKLAAITLAFGGAVLVLWASQAG